VTWRGEAACRGGNPNDFFPERGNVLGVRRALAVCASCLVTGPCLEQALLDCEDEGVWGGTTPKQRRVLRRLVPGGVMNKVCIECPRTFLGRQHQQTCSDDCRRERNSRQRRQARWSA
jgi:WhiB family redox-sensing transcriptional regulator